MKEHPDIILGHVEVHLHTPLSYTLSHSENNRPMTIYY